MGFERGPLLLMIKPRRLLGQVLRVVEQLDGLARALGWRYGAGFLGNRTDAGESPLGRSVRASRTPFRMSSTLRKPDTTALSAHRRAADQNAVLSPRRPENGRLHHRHTGEVIMKNGPASTRQRPCSNPQSAQAYLGSRPNHQKPAPAGGLVRHGRTVPTRSPTANRIWSPNRPRQ